jgi:uncharacterized protein (DUF2141 family)
MGLINYSYSIIGDCNNTSSGGFSLSFTASTPPLSIVWGTPSGGTLINEVITSNPYSVTNLSAGTYNFDLVDSDPSTPNTQSVDVYITSSSTITLESYINTTCGLSNGILIARMPVNYYGNTIRLYKDNILIQTASTLVTEYYFINLESGLYYATVEDYGGCMGTSNSCVVGESSILDFGFFVTNNAACTVQSGQIFVTGITGVAPYTFKWGGSIPSGQTGSTVTGLTSAAYELKLTDSRGCSTTKITNVGNSQPLGLVTYTPTPPTCFQNDGEITFITSGGSAPFNYILSNGVSQTLISNQVTFTGLSAGDYSLRVTDSGLCNIVVPASLRTPTLFSVITTSKTNASCNALGTFTANLAGGTPPYKLVLSSSTQITTQNSNINTTTFSGLIPNTYNLTISDRANLCSYSEQFIIDNEQHFDILVTSTLSSCRSSNGTVQVQVIPYLTGLTYQYYLSNGLFSVPTTSTTYTFTGVSDGFYAVTVNDNTTCSLTAATIVSYTEPYKVFLYPTDCLNGDGGTISALIQETEGPYNLIWGDNVNGQTGIYITGLTAGTYTLTVSGENNCVTSRSVDITCPPKGVTNYSFKYSTGVKETTPSTKLTLRNMMYSGYTSLVTSATNCSLSSATFNFKVNIGGTEYEFPFYYTESFNDIPDLSYFAPIIESSILTIPNIQSCTVDAETNTINILAKADSTTEYYKGETITFTIRIYFVIKCISVNDIICT